jgi:hypothetical protein
MEASVEVPIVHSVDVLAERSASVEVSDFMECDFCNLKSDDGDVSVIKVKTKSLNVETQSGDVFCHGHIQVNKNCYTNQGCQIFLGTTYQNGGNIPNYYKIYQIAIN